MQDLASIPSDLETQLRERVGSMLGPEAQQNLIVERFTPASNPVVHCRLNGHQLTATLQPDHVRLAFCDPNDTVILSLQSFRAFINHTTQQLVDARSSIVHRSELQRHLTHLFGEEHLPELLYLEHRGPSVFFANYGLRLELRYEPVSDHLQRSQLIVANNSALRSPSDALRQLTAYAELLEQIRSAQSVLEHFQTEDDIHRARSHARLSRLEGLLQDAFVGPRLDSEINNKAPAAKDIWTEEWDGYDTDSDADFDTGFGQGFTLEISTFLVNLFFGLLLTGIIAGVVYIALTQNLAVPLPTPSVPPYRP